jgi:uncharacterized protein with HEPN domain
VKDHIWIHYILSSCDLLREYLPESSEELENDSMRQDAVLYRLRIIAESANRLSKETKLLSTLNWDTIRGFRNFMTHEYHLIDLDRVWDIINDDLPELEVEINRLRELIEGQK